MSSIGPDDPARMARREAASEAGGGSLPREQERSIKIVTGGSLTEALAGGGAVLLAILGLADVSPEYMASVATIAIGVALLAQGGAAAARWSSLLEEEPGAWSSRAELGGGLSAELFGGGVGVVLGVLGLLGILPHVLIPVALLVFGGTLLISSSVTVDLGSMAGPGAYERSGRLARDASMAASGTQVLVGVGGIVLGILALVGGTPGTLSLIGLLSIGVAILLSGAAVSARLVSMFRHR